MSAIINSGGGTPTPSSIPGTPGLNAVPITSGLMAEYRMLSTETPASLVDYSGNGRNATGTVGTAPTIITNSGGCNFIGNGSISLPASLNSAQTIIAYIGYQGNGVGTNTLNAIVQGDAAGVAAGGIGLYLASCGAVGASTACNSWTRSNSQDRNSAHLGTIGGNDLWNAQSYIAFNGVGSVALTMATGGVDSLYLNGVQPALPGFQRGVGSAGSQTTGVYQLGGANATSGQGYGASTWFNGQIYYIAFWNRALNPSEVAAVHQFMASAITARGVTPFLFATDTVSQFVADGTSITAGNGNTPYAFQAVLNGGPWNVMENGQPGFIASNIQATALFQTDTIVRPNANKNITIYEAGTNDTIVTAADAQTVLGFHRGYCNARHLLGWKCMITSMMSRNAKDTSKNLLNAEMRQHWNTFADGLVDVAASPLGVDGNSANTVLFSDGIHPTQYADTNIYAPLVARNINALYGNQSFSEATVYAAAAAAATATTAGSEVGNTITITFGATPANCQVGNMITLTGITPTGLGYNDTFYILTRSATQITAFSSVTGLGAITVQGTGVCTQQQDADVYTVVNFTGNFTLQSCVGLTGQNRYIRNINAGAVTLVPVSTNTFGGAAETVTGAGATPTTLAANTTAILQSQLVSSSAAGCNWVRLQ